LEIIAWRHTIAKKKLSGLTGTAEPSLPVGESLCCSGVHKDRVGESPTGIQSGDLSTKVKTPTDETFVMTYPQQCPFPSGNALNNSAVLDDAELIESS
jgi:hypothetical protein